MSIPSTNSVPSPTISTIVDSQKNNKNKTLFTSEYCRVVLRRDQASFGHCRIAPKKEGISFSEMDCTKGEGLNIAADIRKCAKKIEETYKFLFNMTTYALIPEGRSAIEGEKPCKKGCHHFIPHFNGDILFGGQEYTNITTISSSEKLNDKNFSFTPGQMDLFIELFNGVSTGAKGSQDGKVSEKK